MPRQFGLTVVLVIAGLLLAALSCQMLKRAADPVEPRAPLTKKGPAKSEASFDGPDAHRPHIPIVLTKVASGFEQPTALHFVPGAPTTALVLEKTGSLKWLDIETGASGTVVTIDVTTESEQGLLGIAFHPGFLENRRFFLHYTLKRDRELSRVEEWRAAPSFAQPGTKPVRVILELEQPYANHNGGHLAFGPDGFLYVGFGDGGHRADPHRAGQNLKTLLGKMLRLDVDKVVADAGYSIPRDNPLVGRRDARAEIWAWGLRNPWRYSFAPDGRLVVADVGQDAWEEVGFCQQGDNLGWKVREARHCFEPRTGCPAEGFREPFYEYGRTEGQSVTGGVVVTGKHVPALNNRYVFGDFVQGRLWALELPDSTFTGLVEVAALGKWPILPSHFALDAAGTLFIVDFAGSIFRVDPLSEDLVQPDQQPGAESTTGKK